MSRSILEYNRQWREEHLGYMKAYREKHRQRNVEYQKKWREQHPEKHRERNRKYAEKHPRRIKARNFVNNRKLPLGSECEFCGASENLQHGHIDYNYPEIYLTVCPKCNVWMERDVSG